MTSVLRIFPPVGEWPQATRELTELPRTSKRIRLVSGAKGFENLPEFTQLESLWGFGIDQDKLNHIAGCTSLRELHLEYNLRFTDLKCLLKLSKLEVLTLDSCSRINSLDQLSNFTSLVGLAIVNFKHVRSIEPLGALTNLKELAVEGSIWTRMKIDSLSPINNLRKLEFIGLTNLKVADESLAPLSNLTNLKRAHFANFYPFAEFARLSAKLPNCECQWFAPFVSTTLKCESCNSERVLLTGKGKSLLCRKCDAGKVARHVATFEKVKNSVRPGA